jgi:hypothetical protein
MPWINEGKSAAIFCRQVAVLVPDMFCTFYLVKKYKIANNSATTKAKENKTRFGVYRISKENYVCLTKFSNFN